MHTPPGMTLDAPAGRARRPAWPLRPALAAGAALLTGLLGCGGDPEGAAPTGYGASGLALVDLGGDGRLDIVSSNTGPCGGDGIVSALIQDPSQPGGFRPPVASTAGYGARALAAASLSRGAPPSVAVVNPQDAFGPGDGTVSVLQQDPAQPGAFLAPARLQLGSRVPGAVTLADLGGGLAAAIVAADGGDDLLLFPQASPGVFAAPVSVFAGGTPTAAAVADLDGDGRPDLVVATSGETLSILLQDPAHPGTFLPPAACTVGPGPTAVTVADLNGDGRPDLAVALCGSPGAPTRLGLAVLLQDPARPGTFLAATAYDAGDAYSDAVAVADLDGDGRPDLVLANYGLPGVPGSLSVFLQDPDRPGTFLGPAWYPGLYGPTAVAIGDLNGDGRPDLASADGGVVVRYQIAGQPGQFGPPVAYPQ